ncbi:MAG: hypothetical protein F6J87_14610 [Spirulina sp. SIO3F2]|nr:hypothetical protein [Spirulina sp. SIO3F2]
MSLYTNWVCFNCRKRFRALPLNKTDAIAERLCPECGRAMCDMGVYFEPPGKRAKKSWQIVQLLAENGYRFRTEGSVAYIKTFILCSKRPRLEDVKRIIAMEKEYTEICKLKERLAYHKAEKIRRKYLR